MIGDTCTDTDSYPKISVTIGKGANGEAMDNGDNTEMIDEVMTDDGVEKGVKNHIKIGRALPKEVKWGEDSESIEAGVHAEIRRRKRKSEKVGQRIADIIKVRHRNRKDGKKNEKRIVDGIEAKIERKERR